MLVKLGVQYMGHLEFQVTINFYGRWGRVDVVRDVVEGCWLNLRYMEDRMDSVEVVRKFD